MASSSVTNKSNIGLIFVLVTMLIWTGTNAQPDYCSNAIVSMLPCLSYVSGQNPGSNPSSSCCSALASVVESQPQCLCFLLNGGTIYGVRIDPQLARALPAACNVQTPPASLCNGKNDVSFFKIFFFCSITN